MQKGYLYTIKMKRRTEKLHGIVIDVGNEWVALQHNPVDYVIDGIILIRKNHIEYFVRDDKDIFSEKVIKAKPNIYFPCIMFSLNKTHSPFLNFMNELCTIQFDLHDDTVAYLGVIIKLSEKSFRIKSLLPSGIWGKEESYKIEKIRTISFNNDYINSLMAYNQSILIENDASK